NMTDAVTTRTSRTDLDGYSRISPVSRHTDPMQAQFDGVPVPCYVWHRDDGTFVLERANRAAYEMTGPRLDEVIGRTVSEVFANQPEVAADLEAVNTTGRAVQRELDYGRGMDGTYRWLN